MDVVVMIAYGVVAAAAVAGGILLARVVWRKAPPVGAEAGATGRARSAAAHGTGDVGPADLAAPSRGCRE